MKEHFKLIGVLILILLFYIVSTLFIQTNMNRSLLLVYLLFILLISVSSTIYWIKKRIKIQCFRVLFYPLISAALMLPLQLLLIFGNIYRIYVDTSVDDQVAEFIHLFGVAHIIMVLAVTMSIAAFSGLILDIFHLLKKIKKEKKQENV